MMYRLTLLKDLPNYPSGTIFKSELKPRTTLRNTRVYEVIVPYHGNTNNYIMENWTVGGIIDDPNWFKKEIDQDELVNLRCPKCGGTQGAFFSTDYYRHDSGYDDYGLQFSVGFECLCGHKRILYGTHFGNKRLAEIMNGEASTLS